MRRFLFLPLLSLLALLAWFAWRHPERLPYLRSWLSPSFTVLVLGLDEGNRSDAIFLVYVNKTGLKALILPRDTYCTGGRKINGLYKRLGPQGFTKLVSQIVAHPIEGYIVVPFQSLPAFFDRTFPDGLTVPVPYRLRYADRAAGFSYDIPPGIRRLRGRDLAFYLRDRYSDPRKRGEAARVERWKLFLQAALAELRQPKNLPRLPAIVSDAHQTFPTNLSVGQVMFIAKAFIQTQNFSVSYLPGRSFRLNGIWFVQLDKEATRRQARLARLGVVIPKDLRVWVLNGTTEPHLARKMAERLQRHLGIQCFAGNAPSAFVATTTVEYTEGTLIPLAEEIGKEVGARRVVRKKDADNFINPSIIVTIGQDQASRWLWEVKKP
jgi:anionic cell wall polymer biosynthesis LytR-Cps2A-Psr (LCP) family protein